jgi:hypothetical protein
MLFRTWVRLPPGPPKVHKWITNVPTLSHQFIGNALITKAKFSCALCIFEGPVQVSTGDAK